MTCRTSVDHCRPVLITLMIALVAVFGMNCCSFGDDLILAFDNPALDNPALDNPADHDDGVMSVTDEANEGLNFPLDGDLDSPAEIDKTLDEFSQLLDEEKGLPLIPEPNTLVLLALAALLLLLWRFKW